MTDQPRLELESDQDIADLIEALAETSADPYTIAGILNRRGVLAPDGEPWTGWMVRGFLRETGGRS